MKQHFYFSLLLRINWKRNDNENELLYKKYLTGYDISMDQIWWYFSLGLKLGAWEDTWAHLKVGFQWYYNSLKKCLYPPLYLPFTVEGIVECRYLRPLWWKWGDIDRNKTLLALASWLVSPVDLFTSLSTMWRNSCLYREVGREAKVWQSFKEYSFMSLPEGQIQTLRVASLVYSICPGAPRTLRL